MKIYLGDFTANYSRFLLSNPKQFMASGSSQGPEVHMIRDHTIEVTGSYNEGTFAGRRIAGVLSYNIGSTASRLTLQFDVNRDKYYLGLGFTPSSVPIDAKLLDTRASLLNAEFCTTDSHNTNNGGSGQFPSAVVIRTEDLLAVAEYSGLDDRHNLIIRVDLIERISKLAVVKPTNFATGMRVMENGSSMLDIPDLGSMESCITGARGCVVEIANGLSVKLENFSPFMSHASDYVLLPPHILPFTREMFYASDESYTEGMFSYAIEKTNLQLSVVFRVSPGNNSFATAIARKGAPTDAASLNSYVVHEPWKIRPYIFAQAADGEQVLEFRNLRVTASMTTGDKSVLKMVVSAF